MEDYQTSDPVLSAYLKAKGFRVLNTFERNKLVYFVFEQNAEEVAHDWNFNPDLEMELVQTFQKDSSLIFKFIGDRKNTRGEKKDLGGI